MKTKKFGKKFMLNKHTIAELSQDNQGAVKGGYPETKYTWCFCGTTYNLTCGNPTNCQCVTQAACDSLIDPGCPSGVYCD